MKKFIFNYVLCLLLGISSFGSTLAQCFNTQQWPTSNISAPVFSGQSVTIANTNWAGHFCVIKDLIPGKSYTFASTGADIITYRIENGQVGNPPLGFGNSPYTFTATGQYGEFHINLISPPCGTQNVFRTTTIICNDCLPEPPKVGVGASSPMATFDVNGEIKLGNAQRPAQAGMVRWNESTTDFEGFDGNQWRSFTKASSVWGNQPTNEGVEDAKLFTSDGSLGDFFGTSVSISGDYAIVGASGDDVGINTNQGSAYIFIRSGSNWTEQAKLTASDGAAIDNFGVSVSISGDYAIVSSPLSDIGANMNQGAAYIFLRSGTTWTEQAKLTASDGAVGDLFGKAVFIFGDYVIVGADLDDIGANIDQGSAYIFQRSGVTWTEQAKVTASDGAASDKFGSCVSISGNYAIIGAASGDIGANNDQGSSYIFLRSGNSYTQQAKLTASDGAAYDYFGYSVSISGNYAIVGAYGDDTGSAYIFLRTGTAWTEQAKLISSDGAFIDNFGSSVSISGDYAIIGVAGDDIGTNYDQGSAYIFLRSGTIWTQQTKLTVSDGVYEDRLGSSVSISGDYAIIGAPYDDISANSDQGSTYIFLKK
ncbi:MAG TPA: FG-GAP repeat protein [Saprospiraceae bacterium]|nr:FG-GAP repeat protein [Saprospiraceae bacterium]